jgi:hypothetical protein
VVEIITKINPEMANLKRRKYAKTLAEARKILKARDPHGYRSLTIYGPLKHSPRKGQYLIGTYMEWLNR